MVPEPSSAPWARTGSDLARTGWIGLGSGWAQKGDTPTAEEVAAHFGEIHEPGDFIIPTSIADEMKAVMQALSE